MRLFLTILIITLVSITSLLSGDHPIKFENFFSVDRLGTPVVSQDGQNIAFTVKKANIVENSYTTQIWLIDSDGNNLKQVTTNTSASLNPLFSPDGESIYFLSDRSGSRVIRSSGDLPSARASS